MAKALVVEDLDDIMPAIEDAMVARGDSFDQARSLEEARAMFRAENYTYILLDLKIPARDGGAFPDKAYGVALLKEIRQTWGKERTPVIAMTSYHSDGFGIATELHELGVNECISKPFNEARPLVSVIEDALVGSPGQPQKSRMKKRASRAAAIDSIKQALREHLRVARKHALALLDRGEDMELLPRPTQQQLASELKLSASSVSRAINDPSDKEIRILWDIATDLNQVLQFKG